MSIRDVERFLELVKTDEKLKGNIVKTIKTLQRKEGKSFNEDQLIENVIIPLAQKRGINFTEKDFLNYADKKTLELREEDLPKVSGGVDKTSKAKLLLGVALLGTSSAAAMNLAQLRHEKPASSIKETSQNEPSENNPHSSQNKAISQSNLPKTEEMAKRIGEEPSRAKLEKELEKNSIENLAESSNNTNGPATTLQNITAEETSKKHIESLQRKEVVLPNNKETVPLTLDATSDAGDVTAIKSLAAGYKEETAANAAEPKKKVKFVPVRSDMSRDAVIQNNEDRKTNILSNASEGITTFQQGTGNADQTNVTTTYRDIGQNKNSASFVQGPKNGMGTAEERNVERKSPKTEKDAASNASKSTIASQQEISNTNEVNATATSSPINQNKKSTSSAQKSESDVIKVTGQNIDRKDTSSAKHEYVHPENWDDMSEDQKFAYLSNFINEIDSNFDQIAEKTRNIFEDDINKVYKDNFYDLNHKVSIKSPGHKVTGYEIYKLMHFFHRNISPQKKFGISSDFEKLPLKDQADYLEKFLEDIDFLAQINVWEIKMVTRYILKVGTLYWCFDDVDINSFTKLRNFYEKLITQKDINNNKILPSYDKLLKIQLDTLTLKEQINHILETINKIEYIPIAEGDAHFYYVDPENIKDLLNDIEHVLRQIRPRGVNKKIKKIATFYNEVQETLGGEKFFEDMLDNTKVAEKNNAYEKQGHPHGIWQLNDIFYPNSNVQIEKRAADKEKLNLSSKTQTLDENSRPLPKNALENQMNLNNNKLKSGLEQKYAEEISGKCGKNLTFTLSEDGCLTISGTGEMFNYKKKPTPWDEQKHRIKKVVIEKGVTSIGNLAFMDCINLNSVEISNSVKTIGESAFYNCSSLISMIIPNGVETIEFDAFENCTSLTSVEIPDSVKIIGEGAFYNCSSLTSIKIPNSVRTIETDTFYNCSSLVSIIIPNSVKTIEAGAFYNCSSMGSVIIPGSVKFIGEEAFYNCSALSSVTFMGTKIPKLEENIFGLCDNLKYINVPWDYKGEDEFAGKVIKWIVASANDDLRDFSKDWFVSLEDQAIELVRYIDTHDINSLDKEHLQRLQKNLNHLLKQVKTYNSRPYFEGLHYFYSSDIFRSIIFYLWDTRERVKRLLS